MEPSDLSLAKEFLKLDFFLRVECEEWSSF